MTSLTLTQQETITKLADDKAATHRKKAWTRLGWAGGFAAAALGTMLFAAAAPIAPIVITIGAVGGLVATMFAAGENSTLRAMDKVKEDVKKDDAIERMQARVEKMRETNERGKKYSFRGMLGFLVTAIAIPIFPAIAPVLIAAKTVSALVWFGGNTARELVEGPILHTAQLVEESKKLVAPADTTAAPAAANENAPSGVANAPAPAQSFNKTGGSAPPAAGFVDDKPPSAKIGGLGM